MAYSCEVRLRPNTFMVLLLRATRSEFGNSPAWGKSSNGLVRSKLFEALMKIANPAYVPYVEGSLSAYMSKFMDGTRPYSKTYYPFNTAAFQENFSLRLSEHYTEALAAMDNLCHTFLDMESQASMRLLAGGIVEALLQDETIRSPVTINGMAMDKASLATLRVLSLQALLLDVWAMVTISYNDSSEAKSTYQSWVANDGQPGFPPTITTRIGSEMAKKIAVTTVLPEEQPMDTAEEDVTVIPGEEEPVIVMSEENNSQGEKEQSRQKAQHDNGTYNQTFINNGIFVEKQVGTIQNIPHVENLVINLGK